MMNHLPHTLARTIHAEKDRVYKPSFWLLYAVEAGGALAAILSLWVCTKALLLPVNLPNLCLLTVLTLLVAWPFTNWLVHLMRIEIGTDAIQSLDYWGVRRTMTWGEIETVDEANIVGFPYWKVTSFRKDHTPIYIPRFLLDSEALREKVIRTASPTNPLRQALEDRTGKATYAKVHR